MKKILFVMIFSDNWKNAYKRKQEEQGAASAIVAADSSRFSNL